MSAPIVGIVGRKQAGKDTAAAGLIAAGYQRRGFADPLKAMAYAIDPLVSFGSIAPAHLAHLVDLWGWEKTKQLPDVRRFLQRLGTDGVRNHLKADAWIERFDRDWSADFMPRVVVPDVRFENEAAYIRREGGVLIRIDRPGQAANDPHPSEDIDAIGAHFVVVNDGTPEDLQAQVAQIAKNWEVPLRRRDITPEEWQRQYLGTFDHTEVDG